MSELLKVLDMTEEEQWDYLWRVKKYVFRSLADLAFKLRDEAKEYTGWGKALEIVSDYWMRQNKTVMTLSGFWIHKSRPIHWIIAALIAKEMNND